MKLINPELKKKCLDFIKSTTSADKVAIIHDADPDGICSCTIISHTIAKLRGREADFFISDKMRVYPQELLKQLQEKEVNKIISLDIALEENPEAIKFLSSFASLMIIDHHKILEDVPKKVILVKPQLLYENADPSQYCTSKFTFDLCYELVDTNDLDWLSCIGILADTNYRSWKEFFNRTLKKYNGSLNDDPFKTKFGKITSLISSAIFYSDKNIPKVVEIVMNAKAPEDVLNSELTKYEEAVQKEISQWRTNVKKKAEFYDDINLIYYEIQPKFDIKSVVSTLISFDYKDKTVIVVDARNDFIGASGRNQSGKVAVNDLFSNAVKGLEKANGGGHKGASGAGFLKKDLHLFKKRIMELLKDM